MENYSKYTLRKMCNGLIAPFISLEFALSLKNN